MVDFNLYLITGRKQTGGRRLVECVEGALRGGVGAVQLREKGLSARELMTMGRELRGLTRRYGARFLINDRVDVAIALDCDGVHLGQQSIPTREARRLLGRERLIGVSTHSLDEARAAEQGGADFVTLGPVFYTPSKARYGEPIGVDQVRSVKDELSIPLFAIGGINEGRVAEVVDAGADGVAVISAILSADDPEEAVCSLLNTLDSVSP